MESKTCDFVGLDKISKSGDADRFTVVIPPEEKEENTLPIQ